MAGLVEYVLDLARDIAGISAAQTEHLQIELLELQKKEAEIRRQLEMAKTAGQRLVNFQPVINGHIQCPDCWVSRAQQVAMRPGPADADNRDTFACRVCHYEFAL